MGTLSYSDHVSQTLFGKTRQAVLSLLYSHSDETFYVRQIVRAAGGGVGGVQRELKELSDAGIIRRIVQGRQVYYQANPQCPVFDELKGLINKTMGIAATLKAALQPIADRIRIAAIYGSVARNEEQRGSDVDLLVVGNVGFGEIVSALNPAQKKINREINPTVYPVDEFRKKIKEGHHFLESILNEEMLFLLGDHRELARLAKKRLAH